MKNILIIEDDPIDLISIQSKIKELGYGQPMVSDHNADMELLIKRTHPTLIISDIFFDNKPVGISLISICDSLNIPLILMTADTRVATFNLANKIHNVAYLVKPFHQLTLQSCINMVMEGINIMSEANDDFCYVKDFSNRKVKLKFNDILFIKAEGNFCQLQCHHSHYMLRTSLTHFGAELNDNFIQVHKSFIINKRHVKKVSSNYMVIIEQEIPIGRKYKNLVGDLFTALS